MTVNWVATQIDDQNGTHGSDIDGNRYFSPASGETVYCTMLDGRKGHGWTAAQSLESALSEPLYCLEDCIKDKKGNILYAPKESAKFIVSCGRCKIDVLEKNAECCWWCTGWLCSVCWDNFGHCGHPEADKAIEMARKVCQDTGCICGHDNP